VGFFYYLCQMKKVVFKYFDTFCYGELIEDEKHKNWFKPKNASDTFGYDTEFEHVFFNGLLQDNIQSMFSVDRPEFKELLGEWFKDRYGLAVWRVL